MSGELPARGTAASDAPPLRGTGVCARCRRHTNDGLVTIIDQATGPGHLVLHCADQVLCDRRRDAAQAR